MNVLVVNAGSSSLKYQLFDMENEFKIVKLRDNTEINIAASEWFHSK